MIRPMSGSDARPAPSCAGYVLVGGRSSRFGSNKALFRIDGMPMALRVARELGRFVQPITLVGDPTTYRSLGLPTIPDLAVGTGPLGGIVTALEDTSEPWTLIAACDLPCLAEAPLAAILDRTLHGKLDAVVPRTPDGRLQPLCAAYAKSALPTLRTALGAGRYKVADALADLLWDEVAASQALPFLNINRPIDLDGLA